MLAQAARMMAEGHQPAAIADALGVSEAWLKMVTGTDAFTLMVRREHAKAQDAQGGQPDQAAQAD